MMKIFYSGKKSPFELVKNAKDSVDQLKTEDRIQKFKKNIEEVNKKIQIIKENLDVAEESNMAIAEQIVISGLLIDVIEVFEKLSLDTQNCVVSIFQMILPLQFESTSTVKFISENMHIVWKLIELSGQESACARTGSMLQKCMEYQPLARAVVEEGLLLTLFDYAMIETFIISGTAIETIKAIFSSHPRVIESYLSRKYEFFFDRFHTLIKSDSYTVRRTCFEVLIDMLYDPIYQKITESYTSKPENLQIYLPHLANANLFAAYSFKIINLFLTPIYESDLHAYIAQNKPTILDLLDAFKANLDSNKIPAAGVALFHEDPKEEVRKAKDLVIFEF